MATAAEVFSAGGLDRRWTDQRGSCAGQSELPVWLAILGWLLNTGLIALHHRLFGAAYGDVAT